jgi:hypothetical protein
MDALAFALADQRHEPGSRVRLRHADARGSLTTARST